jgi:hypothetical protein
MLKEAEILRRKNRHHYLIGGPNGLFIDGVKVLQHTHTQHIYKTKKGLTAAETGGHT